MAGWPDGGMAGWSDGRMAGWLDGRMVGWLDESFPLRSPRMLEISLVLVPKNDSHDFFGKSVSKS